MPRRLVHRNEEELYVTDEITINENEEERVRPLEYDHCFLTDGTIERFRKAKNLFEALDDLIQEKIFLEESK